MKKAEVLSKSREERNDEYEAKIFKDAQTFGIIVIASICVFFFIVNAVISDIRELETGIVSFDYAAILFAYLSGVSFFSFAKTKSKYSIVAGFAFCFAFIGMLILYFTNL
jgi:hypothetical protein